MSGWGLVYTQTLRARVEDLGTLKDRFKDPGLEFGWETGAHTNIKGQGCRSRNIIGQV